jgi:hypothetical protein
MLAKIDLVVGHVYICVRENRPVKYVGRQTSFQGEEHHGFDYVKRDEDDPRVCGYGQDDEQVLKDEYRLLTVETILYGEPNEKRR